MRKLVRGKLSSLMGSSFLFVLAKRAIARLRRDPEPLALPAPVAQDEIERRERDDHLLMCALSNGVSLTVEEISTETALPHGQVMRSLMRLVNQGKAYFDEALGRYRRS